MSPPERSRIIARITIAVGAMNELFNALLDISKIDAGVLVPAITEFPIARLLSRLDATFAVAAHEKGLSLQIVSSSYWVRTDFILLERILLNLLSNAIRYSDRGGIVVGCRRRGGEAWVEVWDSGVGIPPNECHKIFAEFYRVDDAGRERHTGLGLGLAIVERLCRLLGHTIDVISTPGKGSRFRVRVPLGKTRPALAHE
jgi:signal transduction histidine kinase